MANLPESDTYSANITQIDTGEIISGGSSGVANRALKELTNRTRFLLNSTLKLRYTTLSSSSSHTIDMSITNKWYFTNITANTTINFTNLSAGSIVYLEMQNAGAYTLTWQAAGNTSNIHWDGGNEPDWVDDSAKSSIACIMAKSTQIIYGKMIFSELVV